MTLSVFADLLLSALIVLYIVLELTEGRVLPPLLLCQPSALQESGSRQALVMIILELYKHAVT